VGLPDGDAVGLAVGDVVGDAVGLSMAHSPHVALQCCRMGFLKVSLHRTCHWSLSSWSS
jgi:uncharacterized membrane protein YeiH